MKWGKGSEKWEKLQGSAIFVPEVRPRAVFAASPFYLLLYAFTLGIKSDANYSIYLTSAPASSSCDLWLFEACRSHSRFTLVFGVYSLSSTSIHADVCAPPRHWCVLYVDAEWRDVELSPQWRGPKPGRRGWKYKTWCGLSTYYVNRRVFVADFCTTPQI